MKCVLCLMLGLLSMVGYAQNPSPAEKQVHFPGSAYSGERQEAPVAAIKLIMGEQDSLVLGYIPYETGNETYRLVPEKKEGFWLNELIHQRYDRQFSANGVTLVWLLNRFSITTDTGGRYCFLRMKADIFSGNATGIFQPLFSTDTLLSGPAGSPDFAGLVIDALDHLYKTSGKSIRQRTAAASHPTDNVAIPGSGIQLTMDTIIRKAAEASTIPILRDTAFPAGIYRSFAEFTNNSPSITGAFWAEPETGSDKVKLFFMSADSIAQQAPNAWGVCFSNREIYKYETGRLIPIERAGKGFLLSRYQLPHIRTNQAIYWRRAATKGQADTNPFGRNQFFLCTSGSGGKRSAPESLPVATCIDMITGELTF